MLKDDLARECPTCGAVFDRVSSNHVGLATKLEKKRADAGIVFVPTKPANALQPSAAGAASAQGATSHAEGPATAPIIVDLMNMRCGNCKVMFTDELVEKCPVCGAVFDRVSSNPVGLAARLEKVRQAARTNGKSSPATAKGNLVAARG
jgi:predicted  nucleic acid-binding Zn-ribbon protein